ncbi:MAG: zinc-dependent alcohol dehydrogenase family protein [Firmicutes bacterium]|nr:zinc-dependent alcohol dehydrogenase family protein [Bacillota bacterium]
MRAMLLRGTVSMKGNSNPLEPAELPIPEPEGNEILVKISACGVCHTELDEIEGRTPPPVFPVVPGHQVVGRVVKNGPSASRFKPGDRVGIGWIYSSCGVCPSCISGNENLCEHFKATGRDANGGYAEYMVVREDYALRIPDIFTDTEAAPLLCAGSIGYRSLNLTNLRDGQSLGLTGFGASGHLVLKMVKHKYPAVKVFVFARNERERKFALELGAVWAGDTGDEPPEKLNCIIDTTPAWKPVVEALKNLQSGGRLVINAIRKEDADKEYLLKLNYQQHLWLEKESKSVANVTRKDIGEFLSLAAEIPIKPEVQEFRLEEANAALRELKAGKIRGAKVLVI